MTAISGLVVVLMGFIFKYTVLTSCTMQTVFADDQTGGFQYL